MSCRSIGQVIASKEPTDVHVRTSYKLKRRVHSLRRYMWNVRELLQELAQARWHTAKHATALLAHRAHARWPLMCRVHGQSDGAPCHSHAHQLLPSPFRGFWLAVSDF
jgi:hypothetical protein